MVQGPVSDASPPPADFGREWKLTEVMRNHRISSLNTREVSQQKSRVFLCCSMRSSDVEAGGCASLWARRVREWEAGRAVGKNAHPATELVGAGTARSRSEAGTPAASSGEWKFTAASERLCMFKRSFLLSLLQRLTAAWQKRSGRLRSGIPCLCHVLVISVGE